MKERLVFEGSIYAVYHDKDHLIKTGNPEIPFVPAGTDYFYEGQADGTPPLPLHFITCHAEALAQARNKANTCFMRVFWHGLSA